MKKIIIFTITGLNKGGAEKNLVQIVTSPQFGVNGYIAVVVSLVSGYYSKILFKNGIQLFTLLENKTLFGIVEKFVLTFFYIIKNRKSIYLVHSFMPHGGLLAVLIKVLIGKPIFYSVRCTPSKCLKSNQNFIRWLSHETVIRMADVISCPSSYIVNELPKNKNKLVISNGVSFLDAKVNYTIKSTYDLRYNFHSVTICNMRPEKDVPTILKVASQLPEVQFVFVGDGESLCAFKNISNKLELKNVLFVGQQDDIYSYLYFADIYLLLTMHEGFPNTILEAMALQKPVVASDIPQLCDVLKNNQNCLLVENGDVDSVKRAINNLKNDSEKMKRIAISGYNDVRKMYTHDIMVEKNIKVYNSLCL